MNDFENIDTMEDICLNDTLKGNMLGANYTNEPTLSTVWVFAVILTLLTGLLIGAYLSDVVR